MVHHLSRRDARRLAVRAQLLDAPRPTDLLDTLRRRIEQAIEEDRMSLEESAALLKRFEAGLSSYTYLITPDRVEPQAPSR